MRRDQFKHFFRLPCALILNVIHMEITECEQRSPGCTQWELFRQIFVLRTIVFATRVQFGIRGEWRGSRSQWIILRSKANWGRRSFSADLPLVGINLSPVLSLFRRVSKLALAKANNRSHGGSYVFSSERIIIRGCLAVLRGFFRRIKLTAFIFLQKIRQMQKSVTKNKATQSFGKINCNVACFVSKPVYFSLKVGKVHI